MNKELLTLTYALISSGFALLIGLLILFRLVWEAIGIRLNLKKARKERN